VSIPYIYVLTGAELAEILRDRGQASEARAVFDRVKQVARATRLDSMLQGVETAFSTNTGDTGASAALRIDPSTAPVTKASEPMNQRRKR
jgi:hypothetical protein